MLQRNFSNTIYVIFQFSISICTNSVSIRRRLDLNRCQFPIDQAFRHGQYLTVQAEIGMLANPPTSSGLSMIPEGWLTPVLVTDVYPLPSKSGDFHRAFLG